MATAVPVPFGGHPFITGLCVPHETCSRGPKLVKYVNLVQWAHRPVY
jgi:hypothetical protein